MKKKTLIMVIALILSFNLVICASIKALAHTTMLDVTYDDCTAWKGEDGCYEKWYILEWNSASEHLGHNITTIKYRFADNDSYTWPSDIKEDFENSMRKWDNIYFYSYDDSGNVVKHKLVNMVEVESNENVTIYPTVDLNSIATCVAVDYVQTVESGEVDHKHCSQWAIYVDLDDFTYNESNDTEKVDLIRERTGAHEFGHVLGLGDIDEDDYCQPHLNADNWHHEELLMGYGAILDRSFNITYKDIAGVAITRGFHTDNDHKWLNCGKKNDGTYKLKCSICNGVKYVESLSGYSYDDYESCNNNHELEDDTMMAVASYGDRDYYKCKYCEYVAPFSNIVSQEYISSNETDTYHRTTNIVEGLEYSFLEEHNHIYCDFDSSGCTHYCICGDFLFFEHATGDHDCSLCGYNIHTYTQSYVNDSSTSHKSYCSCGDYIIEEHSYTDHYLQDSETSHRKYCVCGAYILEAHSYTDHYEKDNSSGHYAYCACGARIHTAHVLIRPVGGSIGGLGVCKYCGAQVLFGTLDSIPSDYPHTENGSYILPNGIIVLVPEDEEAYFNGTLVFRTGEVM